MTLKIKNTGANTRVIILNNAEILISYDTPVAACIDGNYYRTNVKWSMTTNKHITQWLEDIEAEMKPQGFFDSLLEV